MVNLIKIVANIVGLVVNKNTKITNIEICGNVFATGKKSKSQAPNKTDIKNMKYIHCRLRHRRVGLAGCLLGCVSQVEFVEVPVG